MIRVLLVDDEADIRSVLSEGLRLHGYTVDTANAADEALALARHTGYDVAIVDFVLPGTRGLELTHELRKHSPFLRTIIISGQIDHGVIDPREVQKQLEEEIAADRYLAKPVSVQSVVEALAELTAELNRGDIDWKGLATRVAASKKVKAANVRQMDETLAKKRKKREK